jgi:hypothetical protein
MKEKKQQKEKRYIGVRFVTSVLKDKVSRNKICINVFFQ